MIIFDGSLRLSAYWLEKAFILEVYCCRKVIDRKMWNAGTCWGRVNGCVRVAAESGGLLRPEVGRQVSSAELSLGATLLRPEVG